MNFDAEQKTIDQLHFQLAHLRHTVEEETTALEDAEQEVLDAQAAQETLQHLAQSIQHQVHQRISRVVSSCLSAVFDDPYEFKIEFERKRGRTEAKLLFTRRGLEVDPLSASGGGAVDVAAFALRVAALVLHRPRLRRLIVADEPFRFVSAEYQRNVRSMLETLSKEMGVQIVMVTHQERLVTGKVIQL